MIISEYPMPSNITYIHKIDHRNGSSNKSQWIISEVAERKCFCKAVTIWRCEDFTCWGLHLENNQTSYLGVTKSSAPKPRKLFVAKFIDSNKNSKWHGYPADHIANQQDIPPEVVLSKWYDDNHLRLVTIRKLSKGQKCKL